ncbi:MBL fold metallo-hydrolase [Pseudonocardiaceae bacterium YIM PH 21723]|nr:MBL fold metallo-hydrolase [Pseudonocardiaceae bacterium YIM PH 21723]
MREVANGVFCVPGTDVNWVLVRDGRDLTLIDGGWLGDIPAVEASIRHIGHRPEDVRGILLTHAHIDHLGALNHFHERYETPVYVHPDELAGVRGERVEQAAVSDVLSRAWRPSVLAWSLRIIRAGALKHVTVPHALPFPDRLDLPGSPVPVPCAGHTSGSTAYLLPGAGVVATGDALVTAHPTSAVVGPQLLPDFFTHDPQRARAALDVLAAVPADVIVPGHGDPWRGALADAVEQIL